MATNIPQQCHRLKGVGSAAQACECCGHCASLSPEPNGPNYEQYSHQRLMLYKPFWQEQKLLQEADTYAAAYATFLQSDDVREGGTSSDWRKVALQPSGRCRHPSDSSLSWWRSLSLAGSKVHSYLHTLQSIHWPRDKIYSTACPYWHAMQTAEQGWSCWQDHHFVELTVPALHPLSCVLSLAAMGWVAKMALLLAIVSAEAVCSWAACVLGRWQHGQPSLGWNPRSCHRACCRCEGLPQHTSPPVSIPFTKLRIRLPCTSQNRGWLVCIILMNFINKRFCSFF